MKKPNFIIIFLFFLSCNHGENNDTKEVSSREYLDTTTNVSLSERISAIQAKTILELYISKYVDSLNSVDNQDALPIFLSDTQFDYKNRGIWDSPHNPISVRHQIISRVNNCKALKFIINSKNEKVRNKPKVEENLRPEFIDMSIYDLAVDRIKTLRCK
jgi:hypothetical protein